MSTRTQSRIYRSLPEYFSTDEHDWRENCLRGLKALNYKRDDFASDVLDSFVIREQFADNIKR
ncbi:MAG: hypothetical protein AABX23_01755 [Nanoarchaeota archaeon]